MWIETHLLQKKKKNPQNQKNKNQIHIVFSYNMATYIKKNYCTQFKGTPKQNIFLLLHYITWDSKHLVAASELGIVGLAPSVLASRAILWDHMAPWCGPAPQSYPLLTCLPGSSCDLNFVCEARVNKGLKCILSVVQRENHPKRGFSFFKVTNPFLPPRPSSTCTSESTASLHITPPSCTCHPSH